MEWGSSLTYFGSTSVKGHEVSFGIKDRDRTEHVFVIGKSGDDRARLLSRMALQDIERNIGTVVLDAGGNLTQLILERLDAPTKERVVFLDPSDGEFPFSWNPLDDFRTLGPEEGVPLLAHAIACAYRAPPSLLSEVLARKLFSDPSSSLVSVYDLVTDEKARKEAYEDDAEKVRFEEILKDDQKSVECISENGRYIAKDTLTRNLVGQTEAKFSLEVLKEGGIFLVDLSRIRMFPTRITPIVRMFIHAVHARAIKERVPVGVYLHECVRYLSEEDIEYLFPDRTIAFTVSDTIYSEEDRAIREKTIARASSVIAFSPHHLDLPITERMFYPYIASDELSKLDTGEFAIALSIDSVRSKPFFAKNLPLLERKEASHEDLIGISREKFTTPRAKVDRMFKKKLPEGEKQGKPPQEPGSFSNAFRSIFSKQDAAKKSNNTPQAQPTPAPPSPPQGTIKAPPQPSGGAGSPPEISEEELRKMLYVEPDPF